MRGRRLSGLFQHSRILVEAVILRNDLEQLGPPAPLGIGCSRIAASTSTISVAAEARSRWLPRSQHVADEELRISKESPGALANEGQQRSAAGRDALSAPECTEEESIDEP